MKTAVATSRLRHKYTILRLSGGDMVEVPSDTVFHTGDRIQFSLQTNGQDYLYIVSQGSSDTWKPMFPSPEVADGNNRVDEGAHEGAGIRHTFPASRPSLQRSSPAY